MYIIERWNDATKDYNFGGILVHNANANHEISFYNLVTTSVILRNGSNLS